MKTAVLTELDRTHCLQLLAGGVIGRVVFTDAAMPAAHPVVYLLDKNEIVFRTSGGSKFEAAVLRRVVGFQVDEIDLDARTGWSVLGVGEAYEVTEPQRLAAVTRRMPPAWAPNRGDHTVAVPLQRVTGRRLGG